MVSFLLIFKTSTERQISCFLKNYFLKKYLYEVIVENAPQALPFEKYLSLQIK